MQYYRNPYEHISVSLYRDQQNRTQRMKIAEFAKEAEAFVLRDQKHKAPKTNKILEEKFEKEIGLLLRILLPEPLADGAHSPNKQQIVIIFCSLQVF